MLLRTTGKWLRPNLESTAQQRISTAKETEKTQQDILRQFIRYCESIDAVKVGLSEKVRSPSLTKDDISRSDIIEGERAETILKWLRKYAYASLEHLTWEILANTGIRIGSAVSLDLENYYPDATPSHLRIEHSPEKGTQLKNGPEGERHIAIDNELCEIIDDFLEQNRPEVLDEHGREPLLGTKHGRIGRSTIRKYVYKWSRPCEVGEGCPHNRDPETCEAKSAHDASKCPSSRSPHVIRRGYITHELNAGVDRSYVSGRCNVSEEVIEQHYDERNEQERMQVRHRALKEAHRSQGVYGGEE